MKAVRFVARIERSWEMGPDVPETSGESREAALAAFLAEAATRVVYDAVLPGDIVVPAAFAESIPDRMPDYYGLLILQIGSTDGSGTSWDWAAVPLGKFRLLNAFDYARGEIRVDVELVASGKPVCHGVLDCNDDSTLLRLPGRSRKFRDGRWASCGVIGLGWNERWPMRSLRAT